MDWEIVKYLLATLIGPAIYALWKWYQDRQAKRDAYIQEQSKDNREFTQQTHGDAFKQVLTLNELLIQNLISLSNGRFDRQREELEKIAESVRMLNALQGQLTELMRGTLREVSRTEEIFSDIDQQLHTIQGAVLSTYYRNGKEED